MIRLEHVTKEYGRGGKKAVDDLTLHVAAGELFGFIGPNGAGKTTTIKMITGILRPTAGSVYVDGVSMADDPLAAKRRIGFVPDGADLFDRLTGMEYIQFIADMYGVSAADRARRCEEYLSLFEMTDSADSLIRTYSKGMKQKIATIGALVHDPRVWIMDEPLNGLDPRSAYLLKEEMKRQCAAGKTVFFSTHVLEVAEKLCTRLAIIRGGKLAAEGTLDDLRREENAGSLEEIFLELTENGDEKND